MEANARVALNIKRFRLERGQSLGDLARRAGLSKQTLSRLESGFGNPTVETLEALGAALDVSLRQIVTEWGTPVFVQRAEESSWQTVRAIEQRALDEIYGSGYVRTTLLRLSRRNENELIESHSPGTLHHVYVMSGRIRTGPVTDLVELGQGDFVRYPGDVPHRHECLSEHVLLHVVTTLPQVRQFTPSVRVVE